MGHRAPSGDGDRTLGAIFEATSTPARAFLTLFLTTPSLVLKLPAFAGVCDIKIYLVDVYAPEYLLSFPAYLTS